MKNKSRSLNHLLPTLLLFLGLTLLMNSLISPHQQCRGAGNGDCSQFIPSCLCSSGEVFLTLSPCSGPSHMRQSSTNFSEVSLSQGLHFSTNCPTPSTGSQLLPGNQLQLFPPLVLQSCQESVPGQSCICK